LARLADAERELGRLRGATLPERVREAVRSYLPYNATIAVASGGDEELLDLASRECWHFPRGQHGRYAGGDPIDDAEAITQLETARTAGAEFLLIPETARAWLEQHHGLSAHLEDHYARVIELNETCIIYSLAPTVGQASTVGSVVLQGGTHGLHHWCFVTAKNWGWGNLRNPG
jgi:hypothetical protein